MASFGAFEVDLSAGVLRKSGIRLRLPEQSFQLLALLLESPGDLVSRAEMKRRLWPGAAYGDFEHGLNKAINRLRQVLCDSATHPRFIETVPRRGYRFLAALNAQTSKPQPQGPVKFRLAVLPFESLSPEPEHDRFADGFTEELTVQLGQVHPQRISLIAPGLSGMPSNKGKPLDQIVDELAVDFILQGSVRRCRDRVRITCHLLQAADHTYLWAENFERSLPDAFTVQSEVARIISQVVAFTLLEQCDRSSTTARAEFQKWIAALEDDAWDGPALRPV